MRLFSRLSRPHRQSGFTLVEVMVVLLIVGMMSGVVILNIPPPRDPVLVQGEKMASRLRLVSQAGMVENHAFGISVDRDGYSVVKFENNAWTEIIRHDFEFDTPPVIALTQNGAIIDLKALKKSGLPVIRYDNTGIATPFTFSIETGNSEIYLVGHVDGSVDVSTQRGQ